MDNFQQSQQAYIYRPSEWASVVWSKDGPTALREWTLLNGGEGSDFLGEGPNFFSASKGRVLIFFTPLKGRVLIFFHRMPMKTLENMK